MVINKANLISAGCDYYFIVQRIFDQKLESPYNDCFKNVSESKLVNETIINYILNFITFINKVNIIYNSLNSV